MTSSTEKPAPNTLRRGPSRAKDGSISVAFKERGTSELEWRGKLASDEPRPSDRFSKLSNVALTIVDDSPIDDEKIRVNRNGLFVGYNPYESGCLGGKPAVRRQDLRKLSEWLKIRKRGNRK